MGKFQAEGLLTQVRLKVTHGKRSDSSPLFCATGGQLNRKAVKLEGKLTTDLATEVKACISLLIWLPLIEFGQFFIMGFRGLIIGIKFHLKTKVGYRNITLLFGN